MSTGSGMQVVEHDLTGDEVAEFLNDHLRQMRATTPLESKHALDLDGLRAEGMTFWVVLDDDIIIATGALKRLSDNEGEIKSMRTAPGRTRSGVATMLLGHILDHARSVGVERVSLETGSTAFFEPARRLYSKHGFTPCGPFADYDDDPNSAYFTRLV